MLTEAPGAAVHPEASAAATGAARLLESLGHTVEPSGPEALFDEERAWHGLVFGPVEYRLCLRELGRMLGRPVRESDVEPYLWTLADPHGPSVSPEDYLEAAASQQAWAVRVAGWFAGGFDLLVTPTVPEPAAAPGGSRRPPATTRSRCSLAWLRTWPSRKPSTSRATP